MKNTRRRAPILSAKPRFYGRHAVYAALDNPDRTVRKIWGTREALNAIVLPDGVTVIYSEVADLGRMVPNDAPHQGLVIEVEPLDDVWLGDLLAAGADDARPLLVLDQVTDPHNVGAILRSAAAFNALGIITQDRHSPPESGLSRVRLPARSKPFRGFASSISRGRSTRSARLGSGALALLVRRSKHWPRLWDRRALPSFSVPRARGCATIQRSTATSLPGCRFQVWSRASMFQTRPR